MVFNEKFLYFRPRNMIPKMLDQGNLQRSCLVFWHSILVTLLDRPALPHELGCNKES